MYKLIVLIISSPGEIYDTFKSYQIKYLQLFKEIKYFFVEFKQDIEEDIINIDNHIYVKGIESINPGMIIKTCKAIELINKMEANIIENLFLIDLHFLGGSQSIKELGHKVFSICNYDGE